MSFKISKILTINQPSKVRPQVSVLSFSNSGNEGTLTGIGFNEVVQLAYNGITASFTLYGDNAMTFLRPDGSYITGSVSLSVPGLSTYYYSNVWWQ